MTGPAKRSDSRQDKGQNKRQSKRGASPGERDLDRLIEEIYGRVDWQAASGVLHVTAIAAVDRATIALGLNAPSSASDRFVLGFARARADALVTTGSILRAEPTLQHCYAEDDERNAEWQAWRAATLGRDVAPGLILLSRSGEFPADHPAIEAAKSGFVWTSKAARTRLGARVGELEVVIAEEVAEEETAQTDGAGFREERTGLGAALSFARARHGLQRISIEAGPSATRELYGSDSLASRAAQVDELLLSLYLGDLSASARAAKFASEGQVRAAGLRRVSAYEKQEPSGGWSFERYCLASLGEGKGERQGAREE